MNYSLGSIRQNQRAVGVADVHYFADGIDNAEDVGYLGDAAEFCALCQQFRQFFDLDLTYGIYGSTLYAQKQAARVRYSNDARSLL